jgi:hypothetical protein
LAIFSRFKQMRVAIFNGFNFHYEMFGFALDYCFSRGITPILHTPTDASYGWFEEYAARFEKTLDIRPPESYTPSDYDAVFVLTDDDNRYLKRWRSAKACPRVLFFEHYARRHIMAYTTVHIPLRYYSCRAGADPDAWMFPVWNPRATVTPADDGVVRVVSIGNNCPLTPEELAPWFYSLRGSIEFTFINRIHAPTMLDPAKWAEYPNIRICLNIPTSAMLSAVEHTDWLLMLPRNDIQKHDSISAIIPLAYSFRKPLLVAADWVDTYGMQGGLVALDPTRPLEKPDAACMAALDAQREALFARRDAILTKHLGLTEGV